MLESTRAWITAQDPASLPSFVHLACDIKFADTREQLESLCAKSTTQRSLKLKALSVKALTWPNLPINTLIEKEIGKQKLEKFFQI